MVDAKEKLIENVRKSNLFIVLATRNYVKSLKKDEENLTIQIETAREFKKPFFIVIDRNMTKDDRQYLDEYFSKDNIISRMEVDIGNRMSTTYIAKHIKELVNELRTTEEEDKEIRIATPYSDYEETDNK